MRHSRSTVEAALALRRRGLTTTEIGQRLAIPRRTVTDWVAGRVPGDPPAGPLCATCGSSRHLFDELPTAYVYLLGLYLGDGSIATHPGAFKLRITLDAAYPGIVKETVNAMSEVRPQNKVNERLRPSGDVEVYSYSKAWPCLFPQHGPGRKHLRQLTLTGWQQQLVERTPQLLLRGLLHSDGCRFMNTGRGWTHPRYSFKNFSSDIRGMFTVACDLLDLHWTLAGTTVYVSRTADVERLDALVGPKY